MTDVSDTTQPVDRQPGSTVQGNANTTPAAPSFLKNLYSNGIAFRDTVIDTLEKKDLGAFADVIRAISGLDINTRRSTTSPGQFSPGSTNYTNRPTIFVVKNKVNGKTGASEEPIGEFSDWFLNSVQEQDMERTDVVETFGAPHIFVSGRFTRKIVFSGMVRTTQHNAEASKASERVPQHVLLRNFYERFLRATSQATLDYFTRITVDGDIYEGYITNLQLPRDANLEMVMPFALSMICVRRYNIHDADAVSSLSRFVGDKKKKLAPAFASASLTDAHAGFSLSLISGTTDSATGTSVNVGKTKEDGTFLGISPTVKLHSSYAGQVIQLSGDGLGIWAIKYADDGTPVSGTVSRGGDAALKIVLVSYAKLVENAKASNGQSSLNIQFSAAGKAGPVLQIVAVASDLPSIKLKSLVLTRGDGAKFNATIDGQSVKVVVTDARKAAVLLSGIWSIPFSLTAEYATLDGVVLPADTIPSPPAQTALITKIGSGGIAQRGGQAANNDFDAAVARPGVVETSAAITTPAPGTVLYSSLFYFLSTTTAVNSANPFAIADSVSCLLGLSSGFPPYQINESRVEIQLDMGKPTLVGSLFSSLLTKFLVVRASAVTDSSSGIRASYHADFSVAKSLAAFEQGIGSDVYDSFLSSATLSLQYDQGILVSRISKSASPGGGGSLNLSSGTLSVPMSVTVDATDKDLVVFKLTFTPTAAVSSTILSEILSNPVIGSITFPSVYQLEAIPVNFPK